MVLVVDLVLGRMKAGGMDGDVGNHSGWKAIKSPGYYLNRVHECRTIYPAVSGSYKSAKKGNIAFPFRERDSSAYFLNTLSCSRI